MSNDEKVEQPKVDITDESGEIESPVDTNGDVNEDAAASAGSDLQAQLDDALAKSKEYYDQLLRSQAEMDNIRKRSQRELENAHKYAIEKFINGLLPVIDSMELGQQAAESASDITQIKEGTAMTLSMFESLLEKFEIEKINPEGDNFDPAFHQAMSIQETADAVPNSVIAVMQKGYVLAGRLLRPAMVVVAKAPANEDNGSAAEDSK